MRTRRRALAAGSVALAIALAGCSGTADPAADEPMDEQPMDDEPMGDASTDDAPMDDAPMDEEPMDEEPMTEEDAAADLGALGAVTATRPDGSTFTLAEFAGEQLFVETFATWCSKCRRQLGDTTEAALAASGRARFLVLSVESDLDPASLEQYAAENGFEGLEFAVLDAGSLPLLSDELGRSVLNPPSTPKFTISSAGAISELTTGFESADEILAQLEA